jgi:hypothetical protein
MKRLLVLTLVILCCAALTALPLEERITRFSGKTPPGC